MFVSNTTYVCSNHLLLRSVCTPRSEEHVERHTHLSISMPLQPFHAFHHYLKELRKLSIHVSMNILQKRMQQYYYILGMLFSWHLKSVVVVKVMAWKTRVLLEQPATRHAPEPLRGRWCWVDSFGPSGRRPPFIHNAFLIFSIAILLPWSRLFRPNVLPIRNTNTFSRRFRKRKGRSTTNLDDDDAMKMIRCRTEKSLSLAVQVLISISSGTSLDLPSTHDLGQNPHIQKRSKSIILVDGQSLSRLLVQRWVFRHARPRRFNSINSPPTRAVAIDRWQRFWSQVVW